MMHFKIAMCTFVALLCAAVARPQTQKPDSLIVNGDGFVFSVKAPEGWRGDTNAASKYHVDVVFFPSDAVSQSADVTIRVRMNKKVDEHIATDLQAEMDADKKQNPSLRFGELLIDHPSYATYSKLFFVPRGLYEYVSYINPGVDAPYLFSLAMSVRGRPANENERNALDAVARSLRVIDANK